MEDLLGEVQNENGEVFISDADQKRLSAMWGEAIKQANAVGNDSPLYEVKAEAMTMRHAAELKAKDDEIKAEREASKGKTNKALEDSGVHDQDTGAAKAGAGGGERKRGTALIQEALNDGTPLFPKSK